MKDDCTTNSHHLTYTFLLRKVGRMYSLNLGVKGLKTLLLGVWVIETKQELSIVCSHCSHLLFLVQSVSYDVLLFDYQLVIRAHLFKLSGFQEELQGTKQTGVALNANFCVYCIMHKIYSSCVQNHGSDA